MQGTVQPAHGGSFFLHECVMDIWLLVVGFTIWQVWVSRCQETFAGKRNPTAENLMMIWFILISTLRGEFESVCLCILFHQTLLKMYNLLTLQVLVQLVHHTITLKVVEYLFNEFGFQIRKQRQMYLISYLCNLTKNACPHKFIMQP